MEALLMLLDGIAFVVLVYLGLRDDRRRPGTPQTSLFRSVETQAMAPRAAAELARQQAITRSRI